MGALCPEDTNRKLSTTGATASTPKPAGPLTGLLAVHTFNGSNIAPIRNIILTVLQCLAQQVCLLIGVAVGRGGVALVGLHPQLE